VLATTNDEFPEGTLVKTVGGGIDALKQILFKLKKFKFSGYIKTLIKRENKTSEGYLFIREGSPTAAIFGRRDGETFTKVKEGEGALKLIWGDTYDTACSLEVHGRVDLKKILDQHPEAVVDLVEKVAAERKRRAKFSLTWGDETKPPADAKESEEISEDAKRALEERMKEWRSSGYIVKPLEDILKDDLPKAKPEFDRFEENIKRVEFLKSELAEMETTGHEKDVEKINAMFRNPGKIMAIQAAIEDLKTQMEREIKKELEEEIVPAPVKPVFKDAIVSTKEEGLAGRGKIIPSEKEEYDKCNVCGSDLHGKEECPACGAHKDEILISKPEKDFGKALTSDDAKLIDDFTFESFVVGESNRFSQAATLAVSKVQSSAYNPLFICSGAGLGKTHLLNAIGNYVLQNFENKKVLYVSMEKFINEFIEATKANKMASFREKYRNLDFLLLDDVHFIAQQEAVQDELFHTFNTLYQDGKQIVMTSDRPLREVQGIKERLVTRFEAGLVTDIQMPDYELRMAILRKKIDSTDIEVNDDVLNFIARRYTRNIRKLEGALSTLMAYCELMKKSPSIEVVIDALKEETPDAPEEMELVPVVIMESKHEKLKLSHSYLIKEERPVECFELLVEHSKLGYNCMVLTRMNPKRVRELYEVGDSMILWLTDRDGDPDNVISPVLEKIIYRIEELLNSPGKSLLLIDGLDYLISNNNFDAVLRFLRRLIDEVSESQTIYMMSFTPETLDEQSLKILEREMEIVSFM
jgi:chromosomal replication initiator protein DnaA